MRQSCRYAVAGVLSLGMLTLGHAWAAGAPIATATLPISAPLIPPVYAADLTTAPGMDLLRAQWRNRDAQIATIPAMPDAPPEWKTTYDVQPKAGAAHFDDSSWPVIEPQGLLVHRGGGHLYLTWFRTVLTIPAKLGTIDPTGMKVALDILIDDYAEVSVNGEMPRAPGRISPATIQGFNMPNRVMLSESVKPGDKFEIAILAINGPLSLDSANACFFREAKLEFFK